MPRVLWILLAFLASVEGQQTQATFFVPTASNNMISSTIAALGLPGYSQLTLTEIASSQILVTNECVPGGYSYDDSLTCTLCSAGKYSPTSTAPSSSTCINCESGKYSTNLGAIAVSTCLDCANGTYFEGTGGAGISACLACPSNSSSYQGARLLQACVCLGGFSGANGGNCTACNTSLFCLFGQANPCPTNSKSNAMSSSLADCRCRSGFYGDTTTGGVELTLCQPCRSGWYCPGGFANFTVLCPNNTYSLAGSDEIYDCICPNNSISRQNSKFITECVCQSGYYQEFSYLYPPANWWCRPCTPGDYCFENQNLSCPVHASSLSSAQSYTDCTCNPSFKNATNRTVQNYCEDCPVNSWCTGGGLVESCVAHAVAPVQSANYSACACDLGYKGRSNTPCVACDSPKYCYSGLEATCSEGTFSPALSFDRINCSCIAGKHVYLSM